MVVLHRNAPVVVVSIAMTVKCSAGIAQGKNTRLDKLVTREIVFVRPVSRVKDKPGWTVGCKDPGMEAYFVLDIVS